MGMIELCLNCPVAQWADVPVSNGKKTETIVRCMDPAAGSRRGYIVAASGVTGKVRQQVPEGAPVWCPRYKEERRNDG